VAAHPLARRRGAGGAGYRRRRCLHRAGERDRETCSLAARGGWSVFVGVRPRRDAWPFVLTAVFFVAALLSLAVMLWPYMIPYTVTVGDAAAPEKSLSFLF
jgi:Cytochrome bd terminal oxidase subunit II